MKNRGHGTQNARNVGLAYRSARMRGKFFAEVAWKIGELEILGMSGSRNASEDQLRAVRIAVTVSPTYHFWDSPDRSHTNNFTVASFHETPSFPRRFSISSAAGFADETGRALRARAVRSFVFANKSSCKSLDRVSYAARSARLLLCSLILRRVRTP